MTAGSIIPQLDGIEDPDKISKYTFVIDFHEEDIVYTLQEILPDDVETQLISKVRIGGLRSADQLCTFSLKLPPDRMFTWPKMSMSQAKVI